MRVAALCLLALVLAAPARAAVEYDVTSLGPLTLDAWAVNDDGVVVGTMDTGSPYNGYRWTPSSGLARLQGKNAIPLDVNRAGVAAGLYDDPQDAGGIFTTGAAWDVSGNLSKLQPVPQDECPPDGYDPESGDDCNGSYAHGIGDDGFAVGASTIDGGAGDSRAPAYWTPDGTGTMLNDRVGLLEARNLSGTMVGQDGTQASQWTSTGIQTLLPFLTDGQGQTGDWSIARDISDAGVVVGVGATRPARVRLRAFSWTLSGGIRRLDTLGLSADANAIAETGEIVGSSYAVEGQNRAVRWRDGVVTDLNTLIDPASGWVLIEAHDVNESGWIVGRGLLNGDQQGFILRPPPALEVKLDAADTVGEVFDVRLRTANLTDEPLTAITHRALIDGSGAVAADRRGAAYVLLGPAPALPGGLAPRESAESAFQLVATKPGYFPVSAVAQTPDAYAASTIELQILERPATLLDYALLAAGAFNDVAAAAQTKINGQLAQLHKRLLKGIPKWMRRGRTSAADAAIGDMFNLPPEALRFLPSRRKTRTDVFKAFMRGQYEGGRDALKGALKSGGDALYKVGEAEVFAFQYWTDTMVDEQGMPTRLDLGLGLADVAKDAYADLQRKGADANALVMRLGKAATDPAAREQLFTEMDAWRADAVTKTGAALDAGYKQVSGQLDKLNRKLGTIVRGSPEAAEKAAYELSYGEAKLQTQLGIFVATEVLTDKGLGLIVGAKRMVQATRTGEVATHLDDVTDSYLTADRALTDADLIARGGTPEDIATIQRIAAEETQRAKDVDKVDVDIELGLRERAEGPRPKTGVAKPEVAKEIKNVNKTDLHLGAKPSQLARLAVIDAKLPWYLPFLRGDLKQEIRARFAARRKEFEAWKSGAMELKKALQAEGHRFEVELPGGTRKTYDWKIAAKPEGRTTLIQNRELKINGRLVGSRGPTFSDTDFGAFGNLRALSGKLPSGVRSKIEQRITYRLERELPTFGFHGASFNAFDVKGDDLVNAIKYALMYCEPSVARIHAKRWSEKLGVPIERILDEANLGRFLIKVNGRGASLGYGAPP